MATSSFANIDDADTNIPAAPAAETKTDLVAQNTELVSDEFFDNGGFGEIDKSQLSVPYLWLAHGVGKGAELGIRPGSIVYVEEVITQPKERENTIAPADGVLMYILAGLGGGLDYIETVSNAEFEAGMKPRFFKTEAEARKAGLVSKKEAREENDPSVRSFGPRLRLKVLVKARDAANTSFPIVLGDDAYAVAALSLTKGSYYNCKRLLDHVNTSLMIKKPFWWAPFRLYSKFEKAPGATKGSWSIHAQQAGKTDPALMDLIAPFAK